MDVRSTTKRFTGVVGSDAIWYEKTESSAVRGEPSDQTRPSFNANLAVNRSIFNSVTQSQVTAHSPEVQPLGKTVSPWATALTSSPVVKTGSPSTTVTGWMDASPVAMDGNLSRMTGVGVNLTWSMGP